MRTIRIRQDIEDLHRDGTTSATLVEHVDGYLYFKLYETDSVDDDLFVERLSDLKEKQEQIARLRAETERQLSDSTSDPIPLQQVRQALSQFQSVLSASPAETQKIFAPDSGKANPRHEWAKSRRHRTRV